MNSWSASPSELLGSLNVREQKVAPSRLYGRGRAELLDVSTRVAVIGSRRASAQGLADAEAIVIVVSGLALGIDSTAHWTAIDHGGDTIAVLGTGLDQHATTTNKDLQDLIGVRHLLLSQFPPGTPVHRSNFPRRNKLMALIADATIIVEAAEASGTRYQGWEAFRLGRPVLFPESFLNTSAPAWVHEMISYGAAALRDGTLDRVVDDLPYRSAEYLPFGQPCEAVMGLSKD